MPRDMPFLFQELRKQWRESGPEEMSETVDEQEAILREGVGLKLVLSGEELAQKAAQSGRELEPNDPEVSLLAALQHNQEQEAEYLLRDLAVKVILRRTFLFRGNYLASGDGILPLLFLQR